MNANTIQLLLDAAKSGDWSRVPEAVQTPQVAEMLIGGTPLIMTAAYAGKVHVVPERMISKRIRPAWEMAVEGEAKFARQEFMPEI